MEPCWGGVGVALNNDSAAIYNLAKINAKWQPTSCSDNNTNNKNAAPPVATTTITSVTQVMLKVEAQLKCQKHAHTNTEEGERPESGGVCAWGKGWRWHTHTHTPAAGHKPPECCCPAPRRVWVGEFYRFFSHVKHFRRAINLEHSWRPSHWATPSARYLRTLGQNKNFFSK